LSGEAVTWADSPDKYPRSTSGLIFAAECAAHPTQKTGFLEVSTFPRPGQPVYATFDHVIVCGAKTLAVVDNPRERHIQGYLSEAFALRVIIANWKRGAVNNVATMGCLICITLHPMIEILI
jgi:hypothetical protein